MADTRFLSISRRTLIAAGVAALPTGAWAARGQVVTILGDSITAGLGLPAQAALPAQLHVALEKLGVHNLVRGVAPPYPGAFTTIAGKTVRILKSRRQPGRRGSYSAPTLFVENGVCFAQCADGGVLRLDDLEIAGRRLEPREIDTALGPTPLSLLSGSLSLT